MKEKKNILYFFLGESRTGAKTCLIRRIYKNIYEENDLSTIGIDFKNKKLVLNNGKQINLKLYDTAGQERFRSITRRIYARENVDFVVLGYDITDRNSFDVLSGWINMIKENNKNVKLIYLIGNKMDLEESRKISQEEGKIFAKDNNLRFFEVSCKTGEGISEFLDDLRNEITKYEM